jgi:flagellar hook protein FlgE
MPFNIAISGLNAAQTDLEVTGHNIANASTVGFKEARAEFADVYANTFNDVSANAAGRGVLVTRVAQQFSQGTIEFTGNNLDLAVTGEGFFVTTTQDGEIYYTRAGQFSVDRDGYVVNHANRRLQALPVISADPFDVANLRFSASGEPGSLSSLQMPASLGDPSPTENIGLELNLDSTEAVVDSGTRLGSSGNGDWPMVAPTYPVTTSPPPTQSFPDPDSYNHATSTTVYDTLGQAHTSNFYYAKTFSTPGGPAVWEMFSSVDRGDGYFESAVRTTEATSLVETGIDLDNAAAVGTSTNPANPVTFTAYDAQGNSYAAAAFFEKTANQDEWIIEYRIDDGTNTYPTLQGSEIFTIGSAPVVAGVTFSGITSAAAGFQLLGAQADGSSGLSTPTDQANLAVDLHSLAAVPGETADPIYTTVYDANGTLFPARLNLTKTANANEWDLEYFRDDGTGNFVSQGNVAFLIGTDPVVNGVTFTGITANNVGYTYGNVITNGSSSDSVRLIFDSTGNITSPVGGSFNISAPTTNGSTTTLDMVADVGNLTQFGSDFSVNDLVQDGYPTGRLSGLDIESDGIVFARYTNGQSQALGKVALANFNNPQGLKKTGDTSWQNTYTAGDVRVGSPMSADFGSVQSGAVESSNTDIASQLVKLIIAQRNYQANAQVITTANTVTQTILNI